MQERRLLTMIRLAVNGSREDIDQWQARQRPVRAVAPDDDDEAALAADLAVLGFREDRG